MKHSAVHAKGAIRFRFHMHFGKSTVTTYQTQGTRVFFVDIGYQRFSRMGDDDVTYPEEANDAPNKIALDRAEKVISMIF